jgi:hypothetical protein
MIDRDEIIKLAREAGLPIQIFQLERFAALVADAEREACAITAWAAGMDAHNAARGLRCDARCVGSKAASAIRARSQE